MDKLWLTCSPRGGTLSLFIALERSPPSSSLVTHACEEKIKISNWWTSCWGDWGGGGSKAPETPHAVIGHQPSTNELCLRCASATLNKAVSQLSIIFTFHSLHKLFKNASCPEELCVYLD